MNRADKLFALRHLTPFDALRREELVLIAEVARERSFGAGEAVSVAGTPVARLYTVIQGRILSSDDTLIPAVFGSLSLLYNYPLAHDLYAAPEEETTCLLIGKGHFFTLINECPAFTAGLIALAQSEALLYETTIPIGRES